MAIMKKNRCFFTANSIQYIDYKDTDLLKKFLTPYGQIQSRKRSGVAARYQRQLSEAIKRARIMGLLPFIVS